MANWVTYLKIGLNPTSMEPGAIVERLTNLGWRTVYGDYDFAWEWNGKWAPDGYNEAYWETLEKAYRTLQTLAVDFSFHTYEKGKESGHVYY
jgi:hypothetical protein